MTAPIALEWDGHTLADLERMWEVPFVEAYDRIGSTNDRAADLARAGAVSGSVVVADEQTAGRGRRGARWRSAPGSGLWMSFVLRTREVVPQLPLLVGLACAEGIEAVAPSIWVQIKWPNDLLIEGKKVGGILCEGTDDGVIIGIGINLLTPTDGLPDEIRDIATSLEMSGANRLSRSMLAMHILDRFRKLVAADEPFRDALPALAPRDALAGRSVETEQHGGGVARGFDLSGALILERGDGTRVSVISGSVRPSSSVRPAEI